MRKVKKMIRNADEDDSINTWKKMTTFQISAHANQCAYHVEYLGDRTDLQLATDNTVIQYNNSGVPDMQTIDLNNVANVTTAKIYLHRMSKVIEIRNNWNVPINLQVYKYFVREMTATGLTNRISSDLAAKGVTNPLTDPRFYPYDAQQETRRFWKKFSFRHYLLLPGEELTVTLTRRPVHWDPNEASQFLKKISQAVLFRAQGVVAHDTTATTHVGYQACRVDCIARHTVRYTAELNRNFKYMHPATEASLPEETGGFVTSNMDVEHNVRA